jgi:hypothetical protein
MLDLQMSQHGDNTRADVIKAMSTGEAHAPRDTTDSKWVAAHARPKEPLEVARKAFSV